MTWIMSLILIALLGGLAALSILNAPDQAGAPYWLSIGWVGVLILLNWMTSLGIFGLSTRKSQSETGSYLGSLPGISIIVLVYSVVSALLVFGTYWTRHLDDNLHLTFQVIFLVLTLVLVLTMMLATKGAQHGSTSGVTKGQLLEKIRKVIRASTDPEYTRVALELQRYIAHSMPHPAKLDQSALKSLLDRLNELSPEDTNQLEAITKDFKTV